MLVFGAYKATAASCNLHTDRERPTGPIGI